MKEDVPAWEVQATDSGLAVWRICFERRLEPRAAELPRNDGPIAGEESVQRPTVEYARRQGRGKVACDHVCGCWLDRQFDGDGSLDAACFEVTICDFKSSFVTEQRIG